MWTYLQLFWVFFKVGLFTIGGGYAMIPLINREVGALLPELEQTMGDLIGVSEMVPGPFAINAATFAGMTAAGFGGAVFATLGMITPSMIITTVCARFFYALREKRLLKHTFYGMRPAVVGLIAGTVISMLPSHFVLTASPFAFDLKSAYIFALALYAMLKFKINPEFVVIASGLLGLLFFGILP